MTQANGSAAASLHPACALCRGACCESIVSRPPTADVGRWLGLRGQPLADGRIEIAVPCAALSGAGTCGIHATRPDVCRAYVVGGPDCRLTILRRRQACASEILAALDP